MFPLWKKIEHYNHKLIPFAIIVLLIIIIFELFIHSEEHLVELIIRLLDYLVIAIFGIDLIFLGIRAKNIKFFFKNHWLDILAVFPFILFLSILGKIYHGVIALEELVLGQSILHEGLEVQKEIKVVTKSTRMVKFLRIGARLIRVVTKSRLFAEFREKLHLAYGKTSKGRKKYSRK